MTTPAEPAKDPSKLFIDALNANSEQGLRDAVKAGAKPNMGIKSQVDGKEYDGINALIMFAMRGNASGVKLMAELGCPLYSDGYSYDALVSAAVNGKEDCVKALLDLGFDPYRPWQNGTGSPMGLMRQRKQMDAVRLVEKHHLGSYDIRLTEETGNLVTTSGFGARFIQEVFNFAARDRLTLVRKAPDGEVEGMTRDSFDAIDPVYLQAKLELFRQRGGKAGDDVLRPRQRVGAIKASSVILGGEGKVS